MNCALSQIGVSPGGVGVMYGAIFVLALVGGAVVLAVGAIVLIRLTQNKPIPAMPGHDPLGDRSANPVLLRFHQLTVDQLYAVLTVRHAVFVVEQGITSVPDLDGEDEGCDHLLHRVQGRVVGTARLKTIHEGGVHQIKVGRVAVLAEHRGQGIGRLMMQHIQRSLQQRGVNGVMHAQAYLEPWYASLGWRKVGDRFTEAGIDHVHMVYRVQKPA